MWRFDPVVWGRMPARVVVDCDANAPRRCD